MFALSEWLVSEGVEESSLVVSGGCAVSHDINSFGMKFKVCSRIGFHRKRMGGFIGIAGLSNSRDVFYLSLRGENIDCETNKC